MESLEADSIALRPDRSRVRKPLTPLAQRLFRALLFTFEDLLTGLCFPSIATIAAAAGCADSSVKDLLKALRQTGYLTWEPGRRQRVMTRKGWRWVRSSNCYRLLCPHRHLNSLRRELLRATGGKFGHTVHNLLVRYTPPARAEKPSADPLQDPVDDLPPDPPQTGPTPESAHPSRAPPETEGAAEASLSRIKDPKLASVLAGLWDALEQRGD